MPFFPDIVAITVSWRAGIGALHIPSVLAINPFKRLRRAGRLEIFILLIPPLDDWRNSCSVAFVDLALSRTRRSATLNVTSIDCERPLMSKHIRTRRAVIGGVALTVASTKAFAALAAPRPNFDAGLERETIQAFGVKTVWTEYRGRPALQADALENISSLDRLVMLDTRNFGDGVVEAWISGAPNSTASATARGFVGMAFRVQDQEKLEAIYLRPTNGRAEDQIRRNHAVQYISHPEYPWERLRAETPGKYETYVDLEAGRWTHVRIVVAGASARLHVDGTLQPTLIVNDLKHGAEAKGGVALWIGPGTLAHFSGVRISS